MELKSIINKLLTLILSALLTLNSSMFVLADEENITLGGAIASFDKLEESVSSQELYVGSSEDDINLPSELSATLEDETSTNVEVTWESDKEFDSTSVGNTFVYSPSLTQEEYTINEDTKLPTITVTIIENTPTTLEQLETLINQLPTLEEYTTILNDNDEEKYEEVANLLEEIEDLADTNGFDLTQYEKYTNIVNPSTEDDNGTEMYADTTITTESALRTFLTGSSSGKGIVSNNITLSSGNITLGSGTKELVLNATISYNGASTASSGSNKQTAIIIPYPATLTISGTTGGINASQSQALEISGGTLIINGGFYSTDYSYNTVYMSSSSTLTINDGYFKATGSTYVIRKYSAGTINIKGGYYSGSNAGNYIASGYEWISNTQSSTKSAYPYRVVSSSDIVASVGNNKYTSLGDAISAASDGSTIKLSNNTSISSSTTISNNIILDLNGKTLNVSSGGFNVTGSLTVKDSSSGGTITSATTTPITVVSGGKLTVDSGTITTSANASTIKSSGTLTVNGGTISNTYEFEATDSNASSGVMAINIDGGTTTINGGTVKSNGHFAIYIKSGANLTIQKGTNGTIPDITNNRDNNCLIYNEGSLTVTDGRFKLVKAPNTSYTTAFFFNYGSSAQATIQGGKYNKQSPIFYNFKTSSNIVGTTGYSIVDNNDSDNGTYPYTLTPKNPVASITVDETTTKYATLQAAIDAVQSSQTIEIIDNITDETVNINKNNIIIDTNDKSISSTLTISSTDITITGSGSIETVDVASNASTTINNGTISSLTTSSGSTSNITDGTVKNITNNEGTINISGGTIESITNNSGTINITGGTFKFDPTQYLANGYVAVNNGDDTYSIKEVPVIITYTDGTRDYWDGTTNKSVSRAATITVYGSFITSNYLVIGNKDDDENNYFEVVINGQPKNDVNPKMTSTNNENNFIYSYNSSTKINNLDIESAYGTFMIYGDMEISNSNITSATNVFLFNDTKQNLTINSGTYITLTNNSPLMGNNAGDGDNTITINGGTFKAPWIIAQNTNNTLIINNGNFVLTSANDGVPMFWYGTIDINGGTFESSNKTGIFVHGMTSLNLDDCTIKGFKDAVYLTSDNTSNLIGTGVTFENNTNDFKLSNQVISFAEGYDKQASVFVTNPTTISYGYIMYISNSYGDNSLLDNLTINNDELEIGYRTSNNRYYVSRIVYKLIYEFVSSDSTMALPEEVSSLLPSTKVNYKGYSGTPETPSSTSVKVDNGTWNFDGYSPDKYENLSQDVTFTGTWSYVKDVIGEVTLDDENGNSTTISTLNGKITTDLPTPTKDNYDFLGWFTAETGGTQVNQDTDFTNIAEIYAHWSMNKEYAENELTKAKESALSSLDTKVASATEQINALDNLSATEKEEFINKINKDTNSPYDTAKANINVVALDTSDGSSVETALNNAKTSVNTAKTNGELDIDKIVEEAKNAALTNLNNAKKNAISELNTKAEEAKTAINNSKLSDEEKAKYIKQVTDKLTEATNDINSDNCKTLASVEEIKNSAESVFKQATEDANLDDTKASQKSALETYANNKIDSINSLKGLTDAQKDAAKADITKALTDAKTSIDDAKTSAEIEKIVTDTKTSIDSTESTAKSTSETTVTGIKDDLKTKATETQNSIDKLNALTDEQKASYKKAIADELNNKLSAIADALNATDTNLSSLNTIKDEAISSFNSTVATATLENDRNTTLTNLRTYASTQKNNADKYGGLTNDQKASLNSEIDGVVTKYQTTISSVDSKSALDNAYNSAVNEIDKVLENYKVTSEETLATKKTNAANTLDNEANTAKENIDKLGGLTDEQKSTYKNEIDEAVKAAKESINSSNSLSDIDTIVTNTTNSISTTSTNASDTSSKGLSDARDNAKKKLQEEAQKAKDSVNSLGGLTTEEKSAYIKEIEDALNSAESAIDTSTSLSDIDSKVKDTEEEFNTTSSTAKTTSDDALKNAKAAAIETLEDDANKAKEEIDSLGGLTDKEKEDYKKDIDDKIKEAKEAINGSDSLTDIDSKKNNADKDIKDTSGAKKTSEEGLKKAKEEAIKSLEEEANKAKEEINNLGGLTADEKKNLTDEIDKTLDTAKENINNSQTLKDIDSKEDNASNTIDETLSSGESKSKEAIKDAKEDAIKSLEEEANKAKEEIDNLGGLTNDEKTTYKEEIDNKLKEAEENINKSDSLTDIDESKKEETSNIADTSSSAETKSEEGLTNAKDKAKEEVEKSFEEASKKIDSLDNLSTDQKNQYKQELEDKKNEAIDNVNKETTLDSIDSTKNDANSSINKDTDIAEIDDTKTNKTNLINKLEGLNSSTEKKEELLEEANNILEDASKAIKEDNANSEEILKEAESKLDEVFKEARKEAHKYVTPGTIEVTTEYKNSAPDVTLEDSSSQSEVEDKLLTDEEKVEVDNGKNAKIWLEVKDVTETIDSADKKNIIDEVDKIKNTLSSNQTISDSTYLDVSLFKQIEGEEKTTLTGTNKEVTITMAIPSNLLNTDSNITRTYRIIRSHTENGETIAEPINTDLGKDNTITFTTNKFSTYTLVYIDTKTENSNNNNNNNSNNTTNNSGSNNGSSNSSNNNKPCEEAIGRNWTWSESSGTCVYKVSNTGTKR